MKILVTGGAGFIGSAVVRHIIYDTDFSVVNVDKLTYAGNLESLASVSSDSRYTFEQVDICDASELKRVFNEHQPDIVMHLAAESHVDRSIDGPGEFIQTNIVGTYTLLEQARVGANGLDGREDAAPSGVSRRHGRPRRGLQRGQRHGRRPSAGGGWGRRSDPPRRLATS